MPTAAAARGGRLGLGVLRPHLDLLRGQAPDLFLAFTTMIVSTGVGLAIPLVAGRLVDTYGSADAVLAAADRDRGFHIGAIALLLVVQLIGTFVYAVVSARLGLRTSARLRNRVFRHLLELPALYFVDKKAGDLSTRVTSDVGSIQHLLTSGLVSLARAVLTLSGAMVLMLHMNPRLTVAVLLLVPATIVLVRLFGSRLQKLSRRMYDELGRVSSHVQETVSAIRTVKSYNNQNHEADRFGEMVETYRHAGEKRAWLSAAFESAIQISLWVCLIVVVLYGFTLNARGETSSGQLVAFLLLVFRVAIPLASLANLFAQAQASVAAAGRLDDVLSHAVERSPGAPVAPPRRGAVTLALQDLSFSYPSRPDNPVLAGLNADIPAGQRVGVVGPSGAGKTTLLGLLMGLFPPTAGQLRLADVPYDEYELSELRSHVAFVAQEPVLHDLSVRENIRFGLADADDEAVRQAARRAGVLAFTDAMPEGLDAPCGERGESLSGGQRQRVALARAFLRDPAILILDEPTSALDAAAEDRLRRTMGELMAGRTTIVISHRFSLVRDLDRILVLQGGTIREDGPHEELLAKQGIYHHLYGLQSGEEQS